MAPAQDRKLYVTGLAPATGGPQLKEYFRKFGDVTDVLVKRDANGKSRKFGYVTFATKEGAYEALNVDKHFLSGCLLSVSIAVPQEAIYGTGMNGEKLFVGSLAASTTEETLRTFYGRFGEILYVTVPKDSSGRSRRVAFVFFAGRESSITAFEDHRLNAHVIDGHTVRLNNFVVNPQGCDSQQSGFCDTSADSLPRQQPSHSSSVGCNSMATDTEQSRSTSAAKRPQPSPEWDFQGNGTLVRTNSILSDDNHQIPLTDVVAKRTAKMGIRPSDRVHFHYEQKRTDDGQLNITCVIKLQSNVGYILRQAGTYGHLERVNKRSVFFPGKALNNAGFPAGKNLLSFLRTGDQVRYEYWDQNLHPGPKTDYAAENLQLPAKLLFKTAAEKFRRLGILWKLPSAFHATEAQLWCKPLGSVRVTLSDVANPPPKWTLGSRIVFDAVSGDQTKEAKYFAINAEHHPMVRIMYCGAKAMANDELPVPAEDSCPPVEPSPHTGARQAEIATTAYLETERTMQPSVSRTSTELLEEELTDFNFDDLDVSPDDNLRCDDSMPKACPIREHILSRQQKLEALENRNVELQKRSVELLVQSDDQLKEVVENATPPKTLTAPPVPVRDDGTQTPASNGSVYERFFKAVIDDPAIFGAVAARHAPLLKDVLDAHLNRKH